MDGDSGRLGEYPTEDGDITDAGRRQQVAVAVWVLGWLGGPLPAVVALVVTGPPPGPGRRLIVGAAWFWSAVAAAALLLVATTRDDARQLALGWGVLALVALVTTGLAIRAALDRIR